MEMGPLKEEFMIFESAKHESFFLQRKRNILRKGEIFCIFLQVSVFLQAEKVGKAPFHFLARILFSYYFPVTFYSIIVKQAV